MSNCPCPTCRKVASIVFNPDLSLHSAWYRLTQLLINAGLHPCQQEEA